MSQQFYTPVGSPGSFAHPSTIPAGGAPAQHGGMGAPQHANANGYFGADLLAGNEQLVGTASNVAGQFLNDKFKAVTPGASTFLRSLKYYFTVNNRFVLNKIKTILLPFTKRRWAREPSEDHGKYATPAQDENAPDLYIPLMAFVTFVLMTGFIKGTAGKFSPDVLQSVMSSCACTDLLLMGLMYAVFFFMQASVPTLDLLAYTGYKYLPLCVTALLTLGLGDAGYYLGNVYCAGALGFFSLKSFAQAVKGGVDQQQRSFLVLACAALQPLSMWYLGRGW